MQWDETQQSQNVEDRRGDSSGLDVGSGFALPFGGGGLGIGTIIILGITSYALGIDPRYLIGGAEMVSRSSSYVQPAPRQSNAQIPPSDQIGRFVSAILAETEVVWGDILPAQKGINYVKPKLVLFTRQTSTNGCGGAQASMGPFYCPADQKVYLDTSFFDDMKRRYGGGGDFAYAYVIAHEVGHHVENLLGILGKVNQAEKAAASKAQANALSVRIELMADCLAGVWAANADRKWKILEKGDIEKAVATAQAIGDDRLQQAAQGRVVPDSFTHGSSEQRVFWLQRGLEAGNVNACNTFARQNQN
jgi:uncharacterized protein